MKKQKIKDSMKLCIGTCAASMLAFMFLPFVVFTQKKGDFIKELRSLPSIIRDEIRKQNNR